MRTRLGRATLFACLLLLLVIPLASCGGGGGLGPLAGFANLVIGPAGGSTSALNVILDIPPGAFTVPVDIAIFPQPDPLPIQDPSVTYHHGIICIGTVGKGLDVHGHVRLCYDPSGLPPGATEQDLVLLEWEDEQHLMIVKQGAVQDLVNHCFDDFDYQFLGHIAVGVRGGDRFEFVFDGQQLGMLVVQPQGSLGGAALYQVDLEYVLATTYLDGTDDGWDYLPSYDGSRVMYSLNDGKFNGLFTTDTLGSPPFANRQIVGYYEYDADDDQSIGWLGSQDRVYHQRTEYGASLIAQAVAPFGNAFAAAAGGAFGPIDNLEIRNFDSYVDDVRVSPDRTMVLVRWTEYSKGNFTHIDILNATTGAPIGIDLATSTSAYQEINGDATPRWLSDSSGIYFVENDGVTVTRMDPDGSNASTLYTHDVSSSVLIDFVTSVQAPQGSSRCAFVRRDLGAFAQGAQISSGPDYYCTDALGGSGYTELPLPGAFDVLEMVPLPDIGTGVTPLLLQLRTASVMPLGTSVPFPLPPDDHTLVMSMTSAQILTDIPAPISYVDVCRGPSHAGEMLVWYAPIQGVALRSILGYSVPGIYHLDVIGQTPMLVTPGGFDILGPPRWLRSWRFCPGVNFYDTFVR